MCTIFLTIFILQFYVTYGTGFKNVQFSLLISYVITAIMVFVIAFKNDKGLQNLVERKGKTL